MNLKITRPIAFFDIETTGINIATDRIVEISILKILPDNNEESLTMLINPKMPIPNAATEIHGISDKDVKDKPTFADVSKQLAKFLDGCDLAGYNSNKFDVPILVEEFLRAEVDFDIKKRKLVDVQVIFHKMEQRTLSAAYKFYCQKDLHDAHTAEADTRATFEVFKSQLERYKELKNDIDYISKFSSHTDNADFAGRFIYNSEGVEIVNFGKHKGLPVEEVLRKEPAYYHWFMNGDFPLYSKKVLTAIKLRMAFSKSQVK